MLRQQQNAAVLQWQRRKESGARGQWRVRRGVRIAVEIAVVCVERASSSGGEEGWPRKLQAGATISRK